MTALAAGTAGFVTVLGMNVSAWTVIVFLLGALAGFFVRHKI